MGHSQTRTSHSVNCRSRICGCDSCGQRKHMASTTHRTSFGPILTPITLLCDNQAALRLATDDEYHVCTKHIDIRFYFIRQTITDGHINMEALPHGRNDRGHPHKGAPEVQSGDIFASSQDLSSLRGSGASRHCSTQPTRAFAKRNTFRRSTAGGIDSILAPTFSDDIHYKRNQIVFGAHVKDSLHHYSLFRCFNLPYVCICLYLFLLATAHQNMYNTCTKITSCQASCSLEIVIQFRSVLSRVLSSSILTRLSSHRRTRPSLAVLLSRSWNSHAFSS